MNESNYQKQITIEEVENAARIVISKLPDFWKEIRTPQLPRICEEVSWIFTKNGTVVDLGGGSGFHSSICACLGMKAICVDNFKIRGLGHTDDKFFDHDIEAEQVAKDLGVEFIHTDLLNWNPPFDDNSIDVIMSFDNIEHLHHSPRFVYQKSMKTLKKGGIFFLGAPNFCALPKRLQVLFGYKISGTIEDWYLHEKYIGHVREPTVSDLIFIVKDLNLDIIKYFGRNWLALRKLDHTIGAMKIIGNGLDKILRLNPSFCTDIYIIARKIR